MRNFSIIFLLYLVMSLACGGCEQHKPSNQIPPPNRPIPEKAHYSASSSEEPTLSAPTIKQLLSGPVLHRYDTPGRLRWAIKMDKPVSFIRWSPLAGLVVSSGRSVYNITSQSENRWRFVAGKNHEVHSIGNSEIVWSPDFQQLTQLQHRGRAGWKRPWKGSLRSSGPNQVFLIDAATVSQLAEDGNDRWRVALPEIRGIEGVFTCNNSKLFFGTRGLRRIAFRIGERGSLIRKTVLPRGSLLVGSTQDCEPFIWHDGRLLLLDDKGRAKWQIPLQNNPFVERIQGGFAVVSGGNAQETTVTVVSDLGQIISRSTLPTTGRVTRVHVETHPDEGISKIGLCLDVNSPCAKPGGNRGPFNTLITSLSKDNYRVMFRHIQGHLNWSKTLDNGSIIASSAQENSVDLERRDTEGLITWRLQLPGRLTAGPFVGPNDEIYLATCADWNCSSDNRLFSVSGAPPKADVEAPL